MLRSLDIPARVVNGFQRGEWNPYGRYFIVRLLDAHSWVEAYVDGAWATFDPSPRGSIEPGGPPAAVALYLDALRVRWYRYVVGWSLQDRSEEHTSELQSHSDLVCRLLLEKKKKQKYQELTSHYWS